MYVLFVRHWIAQLKTVLLEEFQTLEEKFRSQARHYDEARNMVDLEIMKESYVVGMTTTCAARLQTSLQALKPRIGGHTYRHCILLEEIFETTELYYSC
jgi:hypothetical protein